MKRGWAAGLLAVALLAATPVAAEPVKVRLKEGNSRGFGMKTTICAAAVARAGRFFRSVKAMPL